LDALNPIPDPDKFLPGSDFVVELMSGNDSLEKKVKMQEYRDNGVRLSWLIDQKQAS